MHRGVRQLVILGAACSGANAFLSPAMPAGMLAPREIRAAHNHMRLRGLATSLSMADTKIDKRAERRRIVSSENFNRRGFGETKEEVQGMMVEEFTSGMVKELKENKGVLTRENVTVKLAEYYGFCWGVERAVAMAYEARNFYKDDTIHITNEIIHNPGVNGRLKDMGVNFIPAQKQPNGQPLKDWSAVKNGDVVILPAFGASLEEMQLLDQKGCKIVDTTCPWVSKVWNAVDTHKRKDMTSIIHGKYAHEESIATASMADTYLIVKDMDEAKYVANYILNGGNKDGLVS